MGEQRQSNPRCDLVFALRRLAAEASDRHWLPCTRALLGNSSPGAKLERDVVKTLKDSLHATVQAATQFASIAIVRGDEVLDQQVHAEVAEREAQAKRAIDREVAVMLTKRDLREMQGE